MSSMEAIRTVCLAENNDIKHKVLESIADNYLLKDIKQLLNLCTDDNLNRLEKFLPVK